MTEPATREIDVRGLPPPEPFETIIQSLPPEGSTLRVLIHREPYPLYEVLRNTGYVRHTTLLSDGNYEILITHAT